MNHHEASKQLAALPVGDEHALEAMPHLNLLLSRLEQATTGTDQRLPAWKAAWSQALSDALCSMAAQEPHAASLIETIQGGPEALHARRTKVEQQRRHALEVVKRQDAAEALLDALERLDQCVQHAIDLQQAQRVQPSELAQTTPASQP